MTKNEYRGPEFTQQAHDYLLELGRMSGAFAGVERAVHYPNNQPENDTEHSYHLALSAVELAATYYPELNSGLVAEFSIVHDLPEVYAGDTPSFGLTEEQYKTKENAEAKATERLMTELPPYTARLLERYEAQIEPEARFVRFVDKLLPSIIHSVATDANRGIMKNKFSLESAEDVLKDRAERTARLQRMFPEFQFIHMVRDLLSNTSRSRLYPSEK